MEDVLNRDEQLLLVVNVNAEFTLNGIVNKNARLHIKFVVLVVPVRLESDRHALPPVGVRLAQTVAAQPDDALGQDVGLLVQVHVVLAGVVEGAQGQALTVDAGETLGLKEVLHHF
jgi:hypothetical protein